MQAAILKYCSGEWVNQSERPQTCDTEAQLVLSFGEKLAIIDPAVYQSLKLRYPQADIVMCSTAGEIVNDRMEVNTVNATALTFDRTPIGSACVNVKDFSDSYEAGMALCGQLPQSGLTYIMLISDGGVVNGTDLLKGMYACIGNQVIISGGMAGDGLHSSWTVVGLNAVPRSGNIVAVGFYGDYIHVSTASKGGWKEFGAHHYITSSVKNKVYEIDNQDCVSFYNNQLGSYMNSLPAARLLFPLAIVAENDEHLIRGVLSVDDDNGAITFAGDLPVGTKVRFAKASFMDLINAADTAVNELAGGGPYEPDYLMITSCVGRRIVLGPGVDEEIRAVRNGLSGEPPISGFYSCGEFGPDKSGLPAQLHNQTITLTGFREY
jgi:hypothetical protein